jgi:tRNA(Ile)-lysidine synthase TilS/MesJ
MVKVGDKVAVAVSGGKDSTTLLHLMVNLAKKMDFEVIGINIDLGIIEGTNYSRKVQNLLKEILRF